MGYYWDWVDNRWEEIDHNRTLSSKQRRHINRRLDLINSLLTEVDEGRNAMTGLYARLLVRALAKCDQELMRKTGKLVNPEKV